MTPKQKAEELIEMFKPYVYPYSGSGMLTNTEDPKVIKDMSKICAMHCVDEIIKAFTLTTFWKKVKYELEKL